jgi:preprotein translocase subunit SecA
MAGRGTDILLGGNADFLLRAQLAELGQDWRELDTADYAARLAEFKALTEAEKVEVTALGGLHIIGTERHESRRIDNQLRGRAARQGDPGSTRFYLGLDDGLMRLFGGDRMTTLMNVMPVEETLPISAGIVSRLIENAQRKVEAHHFDIRKNILQYDDVLTEQRQLLYAQRKRVLELDGLRASMLHMVGKEMERCVTNHVTPDFVADANEQSQAQLAEIIAAVVGKIPQLREVATQEARSGLSYGQLITKLAQRGQQAYAQFEDELTQLAEQLREQHGVTLAGLDAEEEADLLDANLSPEVLAERRHPLRKLERELLLTLIDAKWIDYLHNLDALRESIGLRAYGQKDPLIEYKREAYDLFQQVTYDIQREAVLLFFRSRVEVEVPMPESYTPEGEETYDVPPTPMSDEQGMAYHDDTGLWLPSGSGRTSAD